MNPTSENLAALITCTVVLVGGWARNSLGDEARVRQQLHRSQTKYATPDAWAARREELRREFLKGARLWPLPRRPRVKAIVHSRREYGDYSVENIALETLPGFYCTGNLYRPLGRKDLGPAILCPHGHFRPLGRFRENHQIRCAHFARMGATVFSCSMVGWNDANQTEHRQEPLVLALQTWNSIRIVDFLTGLERVDPTRVGVTGASGGGTQSFYLALVDARVKASAPAVIVYPWAAPEGCLCEGGMPVTQAADTNAIELAAATAPRAQLLMSVGKDATRNFPEFGFPFIQAMYDVAGAGDRVRNVHFADEAHDFGLSKRKAVYAFFAKHLQMQPNRFIAPGSNKPDALESLPEDLKKITIEPPEKMEVFNETHPRPPGALQGTAAIARAFETYLAELRRRDDATNAGIAIDTRPRAEYSFKAAGAADEALIFTPPGFEQVGLARSAEGLDTGLLELVIRDGVTGKPTAARVNVVGPDGNYYEPGESPLKQHSLTGVWPKSGWANRQGKAPVRYLGRCFYCDGRASVRVPAGTVRVEVWKGYEYRPTTLTTQVRPGRSHKLALTLEHAAPMPARGYWSGDPHIHIQRFNESDEQRILDLLEAEDIHFGTILAYNQPAGPYAGFMNRMESPQFRRLGKQSIISRGQYSILSGQEYRSSTYGHLNLFLLDELVLPGESVNANNWPPYGRIGAAARDAGGYAFYAHGGYAQAIYADVVQGKVDGVELLQFGVYRGIGLVDWYRMLNTGFRVPATGACDYPACRKLGDCKTYVHCDPGNGDQTPSMQSWLRGAADGRSFVSSGPLLLLEVDGKRPGARIDKQSAGPHRVDVRVRVRSEVAPVTNVQLIANGRILHEMHVPASQGRGGWIEFEQRIVLKESAWVAARAFSRSRLGTPDAESHTNPVYVYVDGKAPYDRASLDGLVTAIDKQIAVHKKRKFPEQSRVITYFERSRDILMKIREAGGVSATGHPSEIAHNDAPTLDPGRRSHTEAELKAFLKPMPAKPIDAVLKSFDTVAGFKMQLVAREPLVNDPIAAAFDEHGNLYVCEMRDYPYKPSAGRKPIGTLRLLKDTDGDGVFDESHVFADELLWAGGVAVWKGGVFVAAAPDIWYLKDTDGDNRADVRRKVYTGFGTGNQQAMLNNLTWGLDHKIYGSTAGNGGDVHHVDSGMKPRPAPISVRGRDFRFDAVSGAFEAITGTVQFGTTFDDWGNRFLCSESQPLQTPVLPHRYLIRNPYLPVPSALQNLAGTVPIHRISPLERWRMIRSSRRIAVGARSPDSAGASHHVIDAAAGVTVYRGGAYPPEYYGNIFIGGAQNNVIHRRTLEPAGVTFKSQRADANTEFVRSSDNWFRPVNFINAPDGTLYVLDMSREILETIHVPLDVMKHIDFKSGRKHGRIYRLAPPNYEYPGAPRLKNASTRQLVAALENPHGWYRDTAHRLLFERQDRAAVEALRQLLTNSKLPQARLHALWSLQGLGALTDADLVRGLSDTHHALRTHAMRLAEPRLNAAPQLLEKTLSHVGDTDARLRFQAAFSLGESNSPKAAAALARLAKSSSDRWIQTAVLSSANALADELLVELLGDAKFAASSAGGTLLVRLATVVGARNQNSEVDALLHTLATNETTAAHSGLTQRLLLGVGDGLKRNGARIDPGENATVAAKAFVARTFQQARTIADNASAGVSARQQAIRLLACGPFASVRDTLSGLLDIQQPEPIRIEAVRALSAYADDAVGAMLLSGWRAHTPAVRNEAVEALLARPGWTRAFLEAAKRGEAALTQVDATRRALLQKHKDASIRNLTVELLGEAASGSRASVIAEYQSALTLKRDVKRGEAAFRRVCMTCHKVGALGHAIGPDLDSSAARDAQTLLAHVLDPNRYVLPNYETYLVVDTGGRTYTGMLAAQTATGITLKRAENKTDTILRNNIEELASTGKSLMPEDLEKQLSKQDMADLIAFLQAARPPAGAKPLHIGTLPGLIEPEK